ncbi:unnamed protein product, partial [Prorocentrum cordatum]
APLQHTAAAARELPEPGARGSQSLPEADGPAAGPGAEEVAALLRAELARERDRASLERARREDLDAQCQQLRESLNEAVAKCILTHNMGRKVSERLAAVEMEAAADARAEMRMQDSLEAELASAERDLKETYRASLESEQHEAEGIRQEVAMYKDALQETERTAEDAHKANDYLEERLACAEQLLQDDALTEAAALQEQLTEARHREEALQEGHQQQMASLRERAKAAIQRVRDESDEQKAVMREELRQAIAEDSGGDALPHLCSSSWRRRSGAWRRRARSLPTCSATWTPRRCSCPTRSWS